MNNKKDGMLGLSSPSKNYMKFSHIDLLSFMGQVVQKHTKHYQSDFEIDKEMLRKSMEQKEVQNQTFVWLCRTAGTWLLSERNVLLKGTSENNTLSFYIEQGIDSILAFVVKAKSVVKDRLIGNVYVLDYSAYHSHVCGISICTETILLQYEYGNRIEKADFAIKNYTDGEYGKLLFIQYRPHSQKELEKLLRKEQQVRDKFPERNPNAYIEKLS